MNWLILLQLFSTLTPEVLALIADIAKAVEAAPASHQAAVVASSNLVQLSLQQKAA